MTLNEKRVISLVANGKRLKQASEMYGISEGMAGKTLHKLYKKLAISNQGELGFLIGNHQLLDLLDL